MTRIVDAAFFRGLKKILLKEAMDAFFGLRPAGSRKSPPRPNCSNWLKLLVADDIPAEALHESSIKKTPAAALRRPAQK